MTSDFNYQVLSSNDIYIPDETTLNPYNNYILNKPQAQSIFNLPTFPQINTNYEQKNPYEIIDCEISMEDSTGMNSNSRPRSPSIIMDNNNYNNPINALSRNTNRARSPNITRRSNLKLDNYSNYFQSNDLSGNNSPLMRSNSISNYAINSYSPIKNDDLNIKYDADNIIPGQYQYKVNSIRKNSSDNNIQQQVFTSPIKNNNYNYQGIFENSPVISRSPNSLSSSRYAPRNIALMNSPQILYNLVPVQNYQYLMPTQQYTNLNNNNFSYLNNNTRQSVNYTNPTSFNNIIKSNPKQYKLKFQSNNITNERNLNPSNIHSNNASPSKNINSFNSFSLEKSIYNKGNNMTSDSKTNQSIINPFDSSNKSENINRSSSPNNINISSFNNQKKMGNKSSRISFNETNPKNVRNSINSINNINTVKNVAMNEFTNNTILSSNNKFNQSNNINLSRNSGLLSSNLNNINNKLNTCSNINNNFKPIDKFSQLMLEQINEIRKNPRSFRQKLIKAKDSIKLDKRGNLYYSGRIKVALYKGQEAFDEAILSLEQMKPMEPLIYKKELRIEISKDKSDFKNGDYLRKKINELVKGGTKVRAFWRDIINDVEINVLLMIVDDNPIKRGAKRKDILNPEMKYVGINSGKVGEYFVCYTVLSDEL